MKNRFAISERDLPKRWLSRLGIDLEVRGWIFSLGTTHSRRSNHQNNLLQWGRTLTILEIRIIWVIYYTSKYVLCFCNLRLEDRWFKRWFFNYRHCQALVMGESWGHGRLQSATNLLPVRWQLSQVGPVFLVRSLLLFPHTLYCLPLCRSPSTVPRAIVFARVLWREVRP